MSHFRKSHSYPRHAARAVAAALLGVLMLAGLAPASRSQAQTPTLPIITIQPLSQTVNAGETAVFTAEANFWTSVQWQTSNDEKGPFINLGGETLPTLRLPALDEYDGWWFRAVFSNATGSAATIAAKLTVLGVPMISQEPQDQTVAVGAWAIFSADASGSPKPTANWEVSTDGGATWTLYATLAEIIEFQAGPGDDGKQFRAIFSNSLGSATTRAATLTVLTPPAITQEPADQLVTNTQAAVFSAAASGRPQPTVQWQVLGPDGKWADVPGATSGTLTVPPGSPSAAYRAVFTNSAGSATTRAATLQVGFAPTITTQPTDQFVNAGQEVTFSADGVGDPAATVQWQVSADSGANWTDIPGATSTALTFTPQPGDDSKQYRALFTNSFGSAATQAATLTFAFPPIVLTQPADQTVDPGQTANFSASASGPPDPTAQWQVSTNGGAAWTDLAGATSPTLSFTAGAGDLGKQYRAVFTNIAGSAASSPATLLVNGPPQITQQPADQAVNAGGTPGFSAAAIASPPATVQWQVSADKGATWTDIPGATAANLTFTAQAGDNGKQYRARFTNSRGSTASNAANLVVNFAPAVTTQPANQIVDPGQTAAFSAAASGFPPPSPQWQVSTDNGATWADVPAAIAPSLSFTAEAGDNGKQYRAVFTNGLGSATTNAAKLTVTVTPGPNVPPSVTVAAGGACLSETAAAGTIYLTLFDTQTPPEQLALRLVGSSNPQLVPPGSVTFGGSGANRTLTVRPAAQQRGTAQLTLEVSDGALASRLEVGVAVGGPGAGPKAGQQGTLAGTPGPDLIFGGNGASVLAGRGGNDLLCGGNGPDSLDGGEGDDTLFGGRGGDSLTGGRGADRFSGGPGKDRATDFNPREGDTQDGTME